MESQSAVDEAGVSMPGRFQDGFFSRMRAFF
jgi:hypothetical protein